MTPIQGSHIRFELRENAVQVIVSPIRKDAPSLAHSVTDVQLEEAVCFRDFHVCTRPYLLSLLGVVDGELTRSADGPAGRFKSDEIGNHQCLGQGSDSRSDGGRKMIDVPAEPNFDPRGAMISGNLTPDLRRVRDESLYF